MKSVPQIALLSLPFAAGVASAALWGHALPGAFASSVTIAILLSCAVASRRRTPLPPLLFAIGMLCWCTEALLTAGTPVRSLPGGAMDALCGAIDGAGFPGEHSAAIIRALLTGRRDALPRETVEAFRRSGASHILALSGMHLGVIYLLIRRILCPLGNSLPIKVLRCAVCIGACAFYTISTGAGPSIVRAFLFILIRECGSLMPGRRLSGAGTLGLALMVQLAAHPGVITSAGFQLSYLAMMGITLLYPRLRAWYPGRGRMDPLRRIWEAAALSISCQLFTAPAAWWHFRSLPGHFLLTNIIALPLTEFIIVTALCGLLLGALGINVRPLVYVGGKAAEMLEFCLETISSM